MMIGILESKWFWLHILEIYFLQKNNIRKEGSAFEQKLTSWLGQIQVPNGLALVLTFESTGINATEEDTLWKMWVMWVEKRDDIQGTAKSGV